ncbi:baseplate J/gp47 family protein [Enterobacteriaceae bacterium LUAb1]
MTTLNTAVPGVTITETGLLVPDIADILSGRLTDMNSAMGGGASQSLSSPQGQIAQSDTEIIAENYDKLLCLFNQINPDYATGRFQDGIGRIYFMERISAQGTIVTATCTGAVGTLIPAGSTAQDDAGYIYQSISPATIGQTGKVQVEFVNQTTGSVPCGSGELNQIYAPVSGWDAVNNDTPGVPGFDVESRIEFETRRRESVAINGRNTDGSLIAGLLEVPGVTDAYVWSNRTGVTISAGTTGFPVKSHSIYICVYGGADEAVAEAIFQRYNPGADLNGDTTFIVYDRQNYQPPYPQYEMQWQKAQPLRIYFRISIDNSLNPPSDITEQVKITVLSVFNGEYDGIARTRIGATINSGKYYAPIISIDDSVSVNQIEISLDGNIWDNHITPGIDQIPVMQESDIIVELIN